MGLERVDPGTVAPEQLRWGGVLVGEVLQSWLSNCPLNCGLGMSLSSTALV